MSARRQQLLLVADGLFAGLVSIGVTELAITTDEFSFRLGRAWQAWAPACCDQLPRFEPGTHDPSEVLFRLHSSSLPFKKYWPSLDARPNGLPPDEYLGRCEGATSEEWKALARAFMDAS